MLDSFSEQMDLLGGVLLSPLGLNCFDSIGRK